MKRIFRKYMPYFMEQSLPEDISDRNSSKCHILRKKIDFMQFVVILC